MRMRASLIFNTSLLLGRNYLLIASWKY